MGKGFNNYMCKKFFHPASADNLKRVWIAQKKADVEKKKQDELRTQYDREQELYQNKALLSKESKERLELNFMYEPPPGVKKIGENDKEDGAEPEYKFEWQRTWGHAPKESYLEKGDDFMEQPFGIQVCQAKCIKCGKFGHMNTDKRCPLYGKAVDSDTPVQNLDQNKLLDEMKAEGLAMRYNSWDLNRAEGPNHLMVTEKEDRPLIDRAELLKTMSKEEKKKLLKKLKKMEKKKKKKEKKEKKKKKRRSGSSSSSSSSNDSETEKKVARSERKDGGGGERRRERSRSRDRKVDREERRERKGERSDSREGKRERSRSRGDRKVDRERKRERSGSRERKRDRSGSRERKRERSGSRERMRGRSGSRERRRDRSGSRERRRERPASREGEDRRHKSGR